MNGILALALAAGLLFVVVAATVSEWRDSGPFRALTYWGFLPLWALYDHAREYGGTKTLWGFSKEEFEEITSKPRAQ